MKKALIGAGALILATVIAGIFGLIKPPSPPQPTPIIVQGGGQNQPTPTPTPTPMWTLTISPNAVGRVSSLSGYYYTIVTAHVVNQASDGDTHDLLASAFHLYPIINGTTNFNQPETLSFPIPDTDYSIAHYNALDITLTFLAPLNNNRFEISLDGASSGGWIYSVTPPSS